MIRANTCESRENCNSKKEKKLFLSKIADIIVQKIDNIEKIRDRLLYKNKVVCPFCCL